MNILKSYKAVQKTVKRLDSVLDVFQRIWDSLENEIKRADNIIDTAKETKAQAQKAQLRIEKFIK